MPMLTMICILSTINRNSLATYSLGQSGQSGQTRVYCDHHLLDHPYLLETIDHRKPSLMFASDLRPTVFAVQPGSQRTCILRCSFLEIYNEILTDLLNPDSTHLLIRQDAKRGIYVDQLSEYEVETGAWLWVCTVICFLGPLA